MGPSGAPEDDQATENIGEELELHNAEDPDDTFRPPLDCAAEGDGELDDEGGGGDRGDAVSDDDDPMNPTAWYREPGVCGSCIAWRPEDPRPGEDVAAGACKLRPELGRVPATLKMCSIYKPRGQFVYEPGRGSPSRRRRAGAATVLRRSAEGQMVPSRPPPRATPMPTFERREKEIEYEYEPVDPADAEMLAEASTDPRPERPAYVPPKAIDIGGDEGSPAVRQTLVDLLRREHGRTTREIHSKYRTGGTAVARATDGSEVKISAERLFAILDRLRSSLDALEKRIEKAPGLEEDREELVANIRRMHGSFTTFNLLFSGRDDYFSGKE